MVNIQVVLSSSTIGYAKKNSGKADKTILSLEVGQKIFAAHSRKILPSPNIPLNIPGGIDQIDRPIAGYLFGKFSRTSFRFGLQG